MDAEMFMENFIRPDFAAIREYLAGFSDQEKSDIKTCFDICRPGIGDKVFECKNYNELNEEFHKITHENMREKFVDFFEALVFQESDFYTP